MKIRRGLFTLCTVGMAILGGSAFGQGRVPATLNTTAVNLTRETVWSEEEVVFHNHGEAGHSRQALPMSFSGRNYRFSVSGPVRVSEWFYKGSKKHIIASCFGTVNPLKPAYATVYEKGSQYACFISQ